MKTTELGLLLQVLPVRIITFVETLGSHLNGYRMVNSNLRIIQYVKSCQPEIRLNLAIQGHNRKCKAFKLTFSFQ